MGMMLGKITVETPKFELLHTCPDYEVRLYSPSVIAEVTYKPADLRGDRDGGFMILANYIGAVGDPQNHSPAEKIAMTAPVITTTPNPEKIAMTAPVLTTTTSNSSSSMVTMQFVLPGKYRKAEEAPSPVDERVVIREEGERKYGVVRFSGVATEKVVEEKVGRLRECLQRDGRETSGGGFLLARYNPPWTIPPFRTNEVLLPLL